MKRAFLFLFVSAFGVCTFPSQAGAIPIPIIWGSGDKLTEMGDLPPEAAATMSQALGAPVKVAFIYERVHIYYGDLWTWNGRHVLSSGNNIWELKPEQWQRLIEAGMSRKDEPDLDKKVWKHLGN